MAQVINRQTLLKARVQHGHVSKRWHPDFAPFIFMKKKNTHIINLDETLRCLAVAGNELERIAQEGGKILFVGKKKQAREIIEKTAKRLDYPFVNVRWLGGTLTNFATIRKILKQLTHKEEKESNAYIYSTKREKLILDRKRAKQEHLLGGLSYMNRLPSALFVVDVNKEFTAIKEARKVGIPVFAIIDTTASPRWVDYPIPANDDARDSIAIIFNYISSKIEAGIQSWNIKKEQNEH